MDHYVPERDEESRRIVRIARDWAREQKLPHVYDGQGICHVVVPQHGHIRPGMFCVGGDSHSPTGGAFGAYMFGIGSTEMLGVMVTGEIWLQVPRTIRMRWDGRLAAGVCAKDMMLHLTGRFGMNGGQYQAVEFCGEAVRALGMNERMTLCNMSAELGAQTGLVAPDATTLEWLARTEGKTAAARTGRGPAAIESIADLARWQTDEAAAGNADCTTHGFDAAALAPQVAAPHSPANVQPVTAHAGTPVHVAYIGACTGAKLDDLRAAAQVLRGHKVAQGVRLMVAPASLQDQEAARGEGVLQVLQAAGAELLPTACGACAGYGDALQGEPTVISSTARNFRGRMGSAGAQVYLGSPYTVAASALRGVITDPREVLA
jgi:3-isopropylmalate/(R)-2-methylmalate dehydratase large subunit